MFPDVTRVHPWIWGLAAVVFMLLASVSLTWRSGYDLFLYSLFVACYFLGVEAWRYSAARKAGTNASASRVLRNGSVAAAALLVVSVIVSFFWPTQSSGLALQAVYGLWFLLSAVLTARLISMSEGAGALRILAYSIAVFYFPIGVWWLNRALRDRD